MLVSPRGVVVRRSSDVIAVDDAHVAAALRFIREQAACERLDVAAVAQHVDLSRRSLERRFGEVLGRTPAQQILRSRICCEG